MEHKGLTKTWLRWMSNVFNFGTLDVLFDGVPGKTFHYKRQVG
jgi:hypothetical protein